MLFEEEESETPDAGDSEELPTKRVKCVRMPKSLTTEGRLVTLNLPAFQHERENVDALSLRVAAADQENCALTVELTTAALNYVYYMHLSKGYYAPTAGRDLPTHVYWIEPKSRKPLFEVRWSEDGTKHTARFPMVEGQPFEDLKQEVLQFVENGFKSG